MSKFPQPADFFSDSPPDRIIGTETEYAIQGRGGYEVGTFLQHGLKNLGLIVVSGGYIENGFRGYQDVGHGEIATPEAKGPRQAAIATVAGRILIQRILMAADIPYSGLYCYSGTTIDDKSDTQGRHENYLFPRSLALSPLFDSIMASHLASRTWAMAGMVGRERYGLSQKAPGIGKGLTRGVLDPTRHESKPMASIPSTIDDVVKGGWARLEVRYADALMSGSAQYLTLAATSLALRLIEHADKIDIKKLEDWAFGDPVAALRAFSADLGLSTQAMPTCGGNKELTAPDYQELLLEAERELAQKIELPADEVKSIDRRQDIIDRMRRADLRKDEYAGLETRLDFAARHMALRHHLEPEEINSYNHEAVARQLLWDRVWLRGGGALYWRHFPAEDVPEKEAVLMLDEPPLTRARARGRAIGERLARGATWSALSVADGRQVLLRNPYNYFVPGGLRQPRHV